MMPVIEATKFVMIFATVALLSVSIAALLWGVAKAAKVIVLIVSSRGEAPLITLQLIQLIDAFLITIVLYLFAVSIYELFIGELALPAWMLAHNLSELKEKLGGVIVLVMAVRFLEHMVKSPPTIELLYLGLATALVAATLIAFNYFGGKKTSVETCPTRHSIRTLQHAARRLPVGEPDTSTAGPRRGGRRNGGFLCCLETTS